ncbi:hypothetical protein BKA82DRAFT_3981096 [Pisolithus tinctorius]|nr:hypothetical protein BKA82DRAFT_3981096 [Pisolithus tinctorius]
MDKFNGDQFSNLRASNLYYPFNSHNEWELASWLLRSGLSMRAIDSFLSLSIISLSLFSPKIIIDVRQIQLLNISFRTARALRGLAELLPGRPRWRSMEITPSQPTKHPVHLYWRDPLECIAWLLNHPLFSDQLDFVPRRVYKTPEKLCRVYTEWMTADDAWRMQSQLPSGATLLGTILSSDKTNITTLCGGRVAHPLLVSLANIKMSTRLKLSSNSFMLAALLPVPKFVHKNKRMRGLLEDRLIHECLDIVLEPVKQAAKLGIMLPDSSWYASEVIMVLAQRSLLGFSQETTTSNPICHNSLPPDHEFQYSRDEDDDAALRSLQSKDKAQPEVRKCHSC